ncbi:MAG: hypothetical protein HY289_15600 [Planctomycetes bacterium]|nr:hypothetical protein [Planctomycetota bacterium]
MPTPLSIFLDFNLPNSTTWFYFSFLLAMTLFFKFSRLLSVRNLDVVMIFLLVPGLLVLQTARPQPGPAEQQPATHVAVLVGQGAAADSPAALAGHVAHFTHEAGPTLESYRWLWFGYLWLLLGSVYFFCRCLLDLTLVQRPALTPNLQIGGLGWLAGALLICLLAVAFRQVERQINPPPIESVADAMAPPTQPPPQTVFAVAILWHAWPTWAVAALAFGCQVAVVVMLVLICWRHFQDPASGMAAATFYLLLPYTGLYVGQVQHVLPMALFLGTLLAYRHPAVSGGILGVATAATYFPAFVVPIWLSFYRERGMSRFLIAFLLTLGLGLLSIGAALWLNNQLDTSLAAALDSPAWLPWKEVPANSTEGFWTGVNWAYRIPVFLLFLSFVIATMFWPAPKNLAHVIALCCAVFIGLQGWCADQGGVYALWYVPLLLLLVFRPNLQDRVPVVIDPETDWLTRAMRWCLRWSHSKYEEPGAAFQKAPMAMEGASGAFQKAPMAMEGGKYTCHVCKGYFSYDELQQHTGIIAELSSRIAAQLLDVGPNANVVGTVKTFDNENLAWCPKCVRSLAQMRAIGRTIKR